ncbi:MAG: response regulator [Parcubacteria group bacterium]
MSNNNSILVIDDNKDFLEIFSTKLESAGFDVITALGAKEGIESAKEKKPDLILLDVEMPEMTGVEVLAKLKENKETKNIRVSFLTNYGEPKKEKTWIDEKFARETGAVDYIKKSEDLDKIVKEVKTLVESNKGE